MVTVYDNGSSFYADGVIVEWSQFTTMVRPFMPMVENYDNGSSFYADGGIAQLL